MTAFDLPSVREQLEEALEETVRETGCSSVVIASRNGLVMAHGFCPPYEPRVLASLGVSMIAEAEATARELNQGDLWHVVLHCARGKVVACDAGPDAVLIALYDPELHLELALLGLTDVARDISKVLEKEA